MLNAGYFPGLYSNRNFLRDNVNVERVFTLCDVWCAHYTSDPKRLDYSATYCMWQYTDSGKVSGVTTNVDIDVVYKDYPTLIKSFGLNGYGKANS